MSVREYEARRDLLELYALLDAGLRPVEIAKRMKKDPAWVSRSIQRLKTERALIFRAPEDGEIIEETLLRLQSLYQRAASASLALAGKEAMAAVRTAAGILHQITEYQIRIGLLEERTKSRPNFSMDTTADFIRLHQTLLKQKEEQEIAGIAYDEP
jgi:hypothetical protein